MEFKHLTMINKQEKAIKYTITEIEQYILDLNNMLDTSDASLLSDYKSRNQEFRRLPAQFQVTLPDFTPHKINRVHIYQQIGSLSKLDITREKHGIPMEWPGVKFFTKSKALLSKPLIIAEINTEYGEDNNFRSVSCLSDSK